MTLENKLTQNIEFRAEMIFVKPPIIEELGAAILDTFSSAKTLCFPPYGFENFDTQSLWKVSYHDLDARNDFHETSNHRGVECRITSSKTLWNGFEIFNTQ